MDDSLIELKKFKQEYTPKIQELVNDAFKRSNIEKNLITTAGTPGTWTPLAICLASVMHLNFEKFLTEVDKIVAVATGLTLTFAGAAAVGKVLDMLEKQESKKLKAVSQTMIIKSVDNGS